MFGFKANQAFGGAPQVVGSNQIVEIGNDYLSHAMPSASPSVYQEYSESSFE